MTDIVRYRQIKENGGFVVLDRAILDLSGSDRIRYLNGQTTKNIEKASAHTAIHACVLSAKGKLDAEVYVHVFGDVLRLDAPSELADELAPRLDRYLIADDVEIAEPGDDLSIIHLLHSGESPAPIEPPVYAISNNRFGIEGIDVFVPADQIPKFIESLPPTVSQIPLDILEILRVEQGIPAWGAELDHSVNPMEANLEARSIDFHKGCYIGQEVISKIKSIGSASRYLRHLVPTTDGTLEGGMTLTDPDSGKTVGRITSAVDSFALDKSLALGYTKRGWEKPDTILHAQNDGHAKPCAVKVLEIDPLP